MRRWPDRLAVLWHLTSLDAPLVAALWCWLLAWRSHTHVDGLDLLALALAVWIVYVADRLADAVRSKDSLEERHRFHRRHRVAFSIGLSVAVPVLFWMVLRLPAALRDAWCLLAIPLGGYFALIHATRIRLPKELAVALLFALGCALPTAVATGWRLELLPTVLFGLLCWMNCVAIVRWEHDEAAHVLTRWAARNLRLLCAALAAVAGALFIRNDAATVALACALAAGLLWVADVKLRRVGRVRLRVLADAALLTPALILVGVPIVGRIL